VRSPHARRDHGPAQAEGLFIVEEHQKVQLAIQRLGLNSVSPFDPKKKIIDYMIASGSGSSLVDQTVRSFVKSVGDRTPTPGACDLVCVRAGHSLG
jgi:glutamate formiminotransferase/formiminotetrahydrofolate cyclodeaminase